MEPKNLYYFTTRGELREWFQAHFSTETEMWLIFPNRSTGKPCLVYNDAVEEALCFGWIDSTVKSLDPDDKIQRFTPRKNKHYYSQANRERLKWLWEHNLIHPDIRPEVAEVVEATFIFPPDILQRLRQEAVVWENYQRFSDSYQRIRIAYIDAARERPLAFEKRLAHFMRKTRQNKIIPGYGGIDKYY